MDLFLNPAFHIGLIVGVLCGMCIALIAMFFMIGAGPTTDDPPGYVRPRARQ